MFTTTLILLILVVVPTAVTVYLVRMDRSANPPVSHRADARFAPPVRWQ